VEAGLMKEIILSVEAGLIDDTIGTILSVPFCLYHFVPYQFVLEPLSPARIEMKVPVRAKSFSMLKRAL